MVSPVMRQALEQRLLDTNSPIVIYQPNHDVYWLCVPLPAISVVEISKKLLGLHSLALRSETGLGGTGMSSNSLA
jgi:hypothetical protein